MDIFSSFGKDMIQIREYSYQLIKVNYILSLISSSMINYHQVMKWQAILTKAVVFRNYSMKI